MKKHTPMWESYPTEINGDLANVRVDMAIPKALPKQIVLRVPYAHNAMGLLLPTDIDRVNSIEDTVHDVIEESAAPILHLGTIYAQGHADFYFGAETVSILETTLRKALSTNTVDAYELQVIDHDAYADSLYPNDIDAAVIMNRNALLTLGDEAESSFDLKPATFFIQFPTLEHLNAFDALVPASLTTYVMEEKLTLACVAEVVPNFKDLNDISVALITATKPFQGQIIGVEIEPNEH